MLVEELILFDKTELAAEHDPSKRLQKLKQYLIEHRCNSLDSIQHFISVLQKTASMQSTVIAILIPGLYCWVYFSFLPFAVKSQ